jgi:putative membrane protein
MRTRAILLTACASLMLGLSVSSSALAHSHNGRHHRAHGRTTNNMREHGHEHLSGYGQECQPGSCERGNAYSAWDEEWLKMSIEGDLFEIKGGTLAEQKGSAQIVKALGQRLVTDHSKSLKDAEEVAKKLHIDIPDSPSPTQEWELRTVAGFSGKTFDFSYSDLEEEDHVQDIEETKSEIEKGCNADIRKLAKEDLPILEEHLKLAKEAESASEH